MKPFPISLTHKSESPLIYEILPIPYWKERYRGRTIEKDLVYPNYVPAPNGVASYGIHKRINLNKAPRKGGIGAVTCIIYEILPNRRLFKAVHSIKCIETRLNYRHPVNAPPCSKNLLSWWELARTTASWSRGTNWSRTENPTGHGVSQLVTENTTTATGHIQQRSTGRRGMSTGGH